MGPVLWPGVVAVRGLDDSDGMRCISCMHAITEILKSLAFAIAITEILYNKKKKLKKI
jgi:hypothetical protein